MKLAYMYATPDVAPARVTAIQGPMEDVLLGLAAAGYAGVELLVCDPARIQRTALRDAIGASGLDVPAICTGEVYGQDGLSFADPDPAIRRAARDRMNAAMDLAAEFGAMVNVGRLRGRYADDVAPERTLAWIAEAIEAALRAFPEVPVVLEPVNRNYANCLTRTGEAVDFVRGLSLPGLGIMLDAVHILVEGEDVAAAFDRAGDLTKHFHISDSDRLPVGDGTYDIPAIMRAVAQSGFEGYVTVETFQAPEGREASLKSYRAMQQAGIEWA